MNQAQQLIGLGRQLDSLLGRLHISLPEWAELMDASISRGHLPDLASLEDLLSAANVPRPALAAALDAAKAEGADK